MKDVTIVLTEDQIRALEDFVYWPFGIVEEKDKRHKLLNTVRDILAQTKPECGE